jgi:hypothetical protein
MVNGQPNAAGTSIKVSRLKSGRMHFSDADNVAIYVCVSMDGRHLPGNGDLAVGFPGIIMAP